MEINNRSLVLLVAIVLALSIVGTISSIRVLDDVSSTGFATNNQTGTIDLAIDTSLSIILTNNTIDFGNCGLDTTNTAEYDSAQGPTALNNSLCSGTFPDNITIQNDGNTDANVTLRTTINGSELFNNDGSALAYRIANDTFRPGCFGVYQQDYTNFTVVGAGNNYLGCGNLTFNDTNDQIHLFAKVWLHPSSTSGGEANITFEAHPVG